MLRNLPRATRSVTYCARRLWPHNELPQHLGAWALSCPRFCGSGIWVRLGGSAASRPLLRLESSQAPRGGGHRRRPCLWGAQCDGYARQIATSHT